MKSYSIIAIALVVCAAGCGSSSSGTAGQSSSGTSSGSASSSSPGAGGAAGSAGSAGGASPGAATPAQQAAQGAQTAAQGMAQLAQGLQALGQNPNVKPVDSSTLKDLLPQVPGWERSGVKAEQVSMGLSISTAEAHYKKGNQSIKIEITDTALSQLVLAPLKMMLAAGYKEETDDGYQHAAPLAGYPGWEEYHKGSQHAESHILVADRFVVAAESDDVDNANLSRQFVQAVNLSKLASLAPK